MNMANRIQYLKKTKGISSEERRDEGEEIETLTKENAYIICEKYSGLIYFDDARQVVKVNKDELLKENKELRVSEEGVELVPSLKMKANIAKAWGILENLMHWYHLHISME